MSIKDRLERLAVVISAASANEMAHCGYGNSDPTRRDAMDVAMRMVDRELRLLEEESYD